MCGIVTIISENPSDLNYIEKMTNLLSHRGPDGSGFFKGSGICMGHRRLSIIDLSDNANQPMHNEDKSVHLVCNGEIYNYLELQKSLKDKGHIFKSRSDCETLLHLYEQEDIQLLNKVNGMFAFAIWDTNQKRLIAATDRFGKKPLYYTFYRKSLALASELKSLLLLNWFEREVNYEALDWYLSLRYVPPPHTIFRNIFKLEPSTMLIWKENAFKIHKYWNPKKNDEIKYNEASADEFYGLLKDSTKLRMQSDVPLGIYLSGGVDSASIGGMMSELSSNKIKSYTLSIDYKNNEHNRAQRIAEHLNFEFNPVRITEEDFGNLKKIVYHLDEPFGDLLCIPAYALAKKAQEQLTVVLTGDGADEILFGYLHQKVSFLRNKYQKYFKSKSLNGVLSAMTSCVPTGLFNLFFNYPDKFKWREKIKLSQTINSADNFGTFYENFTSCFTKEDKANLYSKEFRSKSDRMKISREIQNNFDGFSGFTSMSQLSLLDLQYWIPFSVIYRLDKLNMANAVETRSPFLDYRVVEFALNLEDRGKYCNNRSKVILRDAIGKMYPRRLQEAGKQAFYMPITHQHKNIFMKTIKDTLTEDNIRKRNLFDYKYIEDLLKFANTESMLVNRQLFCLTMLELWFQEYMDK